MNENNISRLFDLTIDGWVVIDKPLGMTATQVVGKVRKLLKTKKVGHLGTLDPLATGILPIAVGEATKTIPYIENQDKEYLFELVFGFETDTGDLEGIDLEKMPKSKVSIEKIRSVLHKFKGEISQTPPIYSAIKINGIPAYKKARNGESFEMKARRVTIFELEALKQTSDFSILLKCVCSKGTYIRSLGRDLAKEIGEKATLSMIRRTRSGNFFEKNAFSLEKLENVIYNEKVEDVAREIFVPLDIVLDDIPALSINEDEKNKIENGQVLKKMTPFSYVRLVLDNQLIALAEQTEKGLCPRRVFKLKTKGNE